MIVPKPSSPFRRHTRAMLLAGAIAVAGAEPVSAQDVEGRVLAAGFGTPIVGATVQFLGTGLVTLTDDEGRFEFQRVGVDADSVRVTRLGYRTLVVYVDFDAVDLLTLELERQPVELEGIRAGLDFAGRLELLGDRLDERIGEWPGTARVVGPEHIRPFDGEWEGNPWKALHYSPLGVRWAGDSYSGPDAPTGGRTWIEDYGYARPEVWIDDRRVWLRVLIETPNESLCRLEVYAPEKFTQKIQPPPQVRAYTCSFMARVATGMETMCPVLQWGRLVSGPDAGGGLPRVDRREAARPPGSVTPIDLGPDLDLSTSATGVGSGACR